MSARAVRRVVLAALVLAAAATLVAVWDLSQHRYFTIDEYQFGHATWLVSQGEVPYVDFYEHHFPLAYLLHAPLLPDEGLFSERALRLRALVFAWWAFAAGVLFAAGRVATGDAAAALLGATWPLALGFGLLSAVDYRADNFAAAAFLAAWALLEANRRAARADVAVAAGVLTALALLFTQKMWLFGLPALAGAWLFDRVRPGDTPLVARPGLVIAAGTAVGAAALVAGALSGVLGRAFELTVLQAFAHESIYSNVSIWPFLEPWLRETWPTALPTLALAVAAFAFRENRFWLAPLAVALLAGALVRGKYPYNYVYATFLVGFCAMRGMASLVRRWEPPSTAWAAWRPALYLLPLLALPSQIGFASATSTNAAQLALLDKIQRHTGESDAVIDSAGGALFRPHASYFYYHGGVEREVYADHFAENLAREYRHSRAPFWIADLRGRWLPESVQALRRRHYVRADGDLYALGFALPRTGERGAAVEIEVIRSGRYTLLPAPLGAVPALEGRELAEAGSVLTVGGTQLRDGGIELSEGVHRVAIPPRSAPQILSALPPEVFTERVSDGRPFSPLFEYRR